MKKDEIYARLKDEIAKNKEKGYRYDKKFLHNVSVLVEYMDANADVPPYKNDTVTMGDEIIPIGKWLDDLKNQSRLSQLDNEKEALLMIVKDDIFKIDRAYGTFSKIHGVHLDTRDKFDVSTQNTSINYVVLADSSEYSNVMFGVDPNGIDRDHLSSGENRLRFANFPESAIRLNLKHSKGDGSGREVRLCNEIAKCIIFEKTPKDKKGNFSISQDNFVWRSHTNVREGKPHEIRVKPEKVPDFLLDLYDFDKKVLRVTVGEAVPKGISLVDRQYNQFWVDLDVTKARIQFGPDKLRNPEYDRALNEILSTDTPYSQKIKQKMAEYDKKYRGKFPYQPDSVKDPTTGKKVKMLIYETPQSIRVGDYRAMKEDTEKVISENRKFTVDIFKKLFPDRRATEREKSKTVKQEKATAQKKTVKPQKKKETKKKISVEAR